MNKVVKIFAFLITMLLAVNCSNSSSGSKSIEESPYKQEENDDRLVEKPYQDSLLNDMILRCKRQSDYSRNPYRDTTLYYVALMFYTANDTARVLAMGEYYPIIFSLPIEECSEHFWGYFRRKNVVFFLYEWHNSERTPSAISYMTKDWHIKDHFDGTEIFDLEELGNYDPYVFEYTLDSIGNGEFVSRHRW